MDVKRRSFLADVEHSWEAGRWWCVELDEANHWWLLPGGAAEQSLWENLLPWFDLLERVADLNVQRWCEGVNPQVYHPLH
ncbi:hypothetical protein KSD_26770 [Ktedonobacter sp. SOSP1-85]|nr:hypothetical protein KSC_079340 [Ktedonobacter sp. SOSP1-52]GHO74906.1 hypothetical protein KSD_26770 [Ktedonobacter sp. SOSP1-85]